MDVVVLGSGPAGFAAAAEISRGGYSVCIITKEGYANKKFQQWPLESLHPGIESILKYLRIDAVLTESSKGTYTGIHSGANFTPFSQRLTEPWLGHHIDRYLFDSFLLKKCNEFGILIKTEKIRDIIIERKINSLVFNTGEQLSCQYLIDATGRTRLLGKKLMLNEHIYSSPLTSWSGVVDGIDKDWLAELGTRFTPTATGWKWFVPEPHSRCTWTTLGLLETRDIVPEELDGCRPICKSRRANVQWRIFRPLYKNRVILTGDAAGILDPGTGQGILFALLAGIRAGAAVVKSLKNEHLTDYNFEGYDQWYLNTYLEKVNQLGIYYKNLGIKF